MSSSSSHNSSNDNNNSHRKWEELPKELLEIIGNHLDSRIDVFRFRSISTSWRSALPFSHLKSQPTTLNLPPPIKAIATFSHFTICRLQHKSNSSACLVKVVESKSSGMLELINPLISRNSQLKSSSSSSTNIDDNNNNSNNNNNNNNNKIISLLDFRLIEVIKGYKFDFRKLASPFRMKKVIMCDDNVGILALFESGRLWYWGFGDKKWTHLGEEGIYYDDVMVYNCRYYVIDNLGIISWIDNLMKLVQYAPPLCGFGQLKNLIVCDGEFYVVDSYLEDDGFVLGDPMIGYQQRFRKVDMKLYKLDEEWGTWVDVKSLGNRVFVLGKEVCFAVSVKDFPGCPGDCVVRSLVEC